MLKQLVKIFKVLVHGEQNEMSRLKTALTREFEADPKNKMQIHNPRNTVAVELYFRGEKTAKVCHCNKLSQIILTNLFLPGYGFLGSGASQSRKYIIWYFGQAQLQLPLIGPVRSLK